MDELVRLSEMEGLDETVRASSGESTLSLVEIATLPAPTRRMVRERGWRSGGKDEILKEEVDEEQEEGDKREKGERDVASF